MNWFKPKRRDPKQRQHFANHIDFMVSMGVKYLHNGNVYGDFVAMFVENRRYRHCRIGRITLKEQA